MVLTKCMHLCWFEVMFATKIHSYLNLEASTFFLLSWKEKADVICVYSVNKNRWCLFPPNCMRKWKN